VARRLRGIPPGHFRGPRFISAPYSLLPLRGRRAERPQARWARFGSHSARTGWACVHRFGCLEGPTCLDPRASTRSPPSFGLSFCCLTWLPALPGGPSIRPSASHPRLGFSEAVNDDHTGSEIIVVLLDVSPEQRSPQDRGFAVCCGIAAGQRKAPTTHLESDRRKARPS
jgi:hypothetical protein